MGLKYVQVQLRLDAASADRLDAYMPAIKDAGIATSKADFIRKAIREALDRAGAPPADTEVDA